MSRSMGPMSEYKPPPRPDVIRADGRVVIDLTDLRRWLAAYDEFLMDEGCVEEAGGVSEVLRYLPTAEDPEGERA